MTDPHSPHAAHAAHKATTENRGHVSTWPLQYFGFALLGSNLGHMMMPVLMAQWAAPKSITAGASYLAAAGLSYYVMGSVTKEPGIGNSKALRLMKHAATKATLAAVFSATTGHLIATSAVEEAAYKAERAAMPRIDAATVIGTKPVTIADQYCRPGQRGQEIVIEHQGRKTLTVCPR